MEEDVNADSEEELDTDDAQIEQGQLKYVGLQRNYTVDVQY